MPDVVQKLWGFCNTLRHDGINYGDYIEQLTYLLFLKLADEKSVAVPAGFGWDSLLERSGTALTDHYQALLNRLGKEKGLLGDIFAGALSKFREPVNLKKLILLINETEWAELDVDLKAEAYEGLLQKFAAEQKGAGQYFTPREAIRAIVRCVQPDLGQSPDYTIHDPAVGTAGFLIAAAEFNLKQRSQPLTREQQKHLKRGCLSGGEIVLETRRLALMNLYLHGIEGRIHYGDSIAEGAGGQQFDCILTNPPFGTKGGGDVPDRDDFTVATSNKQLNFVQHVLTILKPGGRAAMVLPDNVLFEDHAGRDVRQLLHERLPPAHDPAPARRHVHAVLGRRQSECAVLRQRLQDRRGVDLRSAHQRREDHQAQPDQRQNLRGLRESLSRQLPLSRARERGSGGEGRDRSLQALHARGDRRAR